MRFLKKVSIETIPMIYYQGKVYVKRLHWTMKRWKYFYAKNLSWQSDCIISNPRIFIVEVLQVFFTPNNLNRQRNCIVSNPRIFIGEVIQVLFTPNNLNCQSNCIVSNPRIFKDDAIQVLLRKKIWIDKAIVSLQTQRSF